MTAAFPSAEMTVDKVSDYFLELPVDLCPINTGAVAAERDPCCSLV